MSTHHPDEPGALAPEERAVATLLVEHFARVEQGCFTCDLEGYVADRLDTSARRAVEDHVVLCPVCRDALPVVAALHADGAYAPARFESAQVRGDADAATADLPTPGRDRRPLAASARAARPRRPVPRWWGALAAAAALLLVAAAVVALDPADGTMVGKGGEPGGVIVVDASDTIHLGVLRDGVTFQATSGDQLRAGDLVRFFYSADAPGYVALFHLDTAREVSVLYPAEASASAPIAAGREVALDSGARLEAGDRCEWVIGAFSDAPLDLVAARDAIAAMAVMDRSACVAVAPVPGARSVSVVAVRQ